MKRIAKLGLVRDVWRLGGETRGPLFLFKRVRQRLTSGILIVFVFCVGCATIDYTPDTERVARLPSPSNSLLEALKSADYPRTGSVVVMDDFYSYNWEDNPAQGKLVKFKDVQLVEIYSNNNVFLWGRNDILDKVLFDTQDQAKWFADLVGFFRNKASGPGQVAPARSGASPSQPIFK